MAAPPATASDAIAGADSAPEPNRASPSRFIRSSAEEAAGPEHAQHDGVERLIGGEGEAGEGPLAAVTEQAAQEGGVPARVLGERVRRDGEVARLAGLDVAELQVAAQ